MDIQTILNDRGSRYGSFRNNARITQGCMALLMSGENAELLQDHHKEAIHMIVHKLSRIVNGDPDYDDSWRDVAGYAQLLFDEIQNDH